MPKAFNRGYKPLPLVSRSKANKKKARFSAAKKKTPTSNAMSIMKLQRDVRKLKVAEFGQKQMQRQILRSQLGLPDNQSARISANFPVAFCHQAIDRSNQMYQVAVEPISGTLAAVPVAGWVTQPYPLIGLDATSVKFDQLKYLQTNTVGVQPGYLHTNTHYNLKFNAVNWRGWVDVLLVSTRKQYTRQSDPDVDEFQMPIGLAGFSNTCGGTPDQYSWNPLFYGVKRIKRLYFNTSATPPQTERSIYTNPDRYCAITVKNDKFRSHIRAQHNTEYLLPPTPPVTPITHLDIPLKQQDWIVITTSNPTPPTADQYLAVNMTRCCVWRDAVGSS